jgi:hypothetical protein
VNVDESEGVEVLALFDAKWGQDNAYFAIDQGAGRALTEAEQATLVKGRDEFDALPDKAPVEA